jgi:hypothetical protein
VIRQVPGLTDEQSKEIRTFFQGAIYCWCKNGPREWFSLRDLMGGENVLWDDTPLEVLWRRHEHHGKHGFRAASIEAGRLLQRVLKDDRRTFETMRKNTLCFYRWTGDENLVR